MTRLAGKRLISERPAEVETRRQVGHWEIDTVMGAGSLDCVVTLVERKTGLVLIGKLSDGTKESFNRRVMRSMGVVFYFARPYHSRERGSNENANGLIRQYLPKGVSMAGLSQHRCNAIARKLKTRPLKRLGFRTPLVGPDNFHYDLFALLSRYRDCGFAETDTVMGPLPAAHRKLRRISNRPLGTKLV